MAEHHNNITVAAFVDDLRANLNPDLSGMIDVLEEHLVKLAAHPQNAGRRQYDVLGEVYGLASVMPMYDDGIEENLTRPLTEKFGITNIANLAFGPHGQEKRTLAYLICGARLAQRQAEVKQVLKDQYGVVDAGQIEDLTNIIDHELRWRYNGDVNGFFADLAALPQGNADLKERIYELNHANVLKRFAGGDDRPAPNMMS